MEWTPEAKAKMEEMLEDVPSFLRKMVSRQGSLEAERLGQKKGLEVIGLRDMIVGYISATPRPMRENLKKAMIKYGINPDDFEEEFQTL